MNVLIETARSKRRKMGMRAQRRLSAAVALLAKQMFIVPDGCESFTLVRTPDGWRPQS